MIDGDETLAAVLRGKIRARMNEYADWLSTGRASDWATYKEAVGIIRGLAEAERDLLDLVKKESDDES
jgi:hypothetical protein